ncbi:MAG: GFA family protein [Nannocystaceae bacterium]|nr:GFA family protein [Nannocystaceae bacterium]
MCRRWSGIALMVGPWAQVTWTQQDQLVVFRSSDWAERGFCGRCGSSLFYRITAQGPHAGAINVNFGALDDQSGFALETEWFSDRCPSAYALTGNPRRITEAEVLAMFGGG